MLLNFQSSTDWTQVKPCHKCNVLPQVKCKLELIQLTCPICGRKSTSYITYGTQVAIDDWNKCNTQE